MQRCARSAARVHGGAALVDLHNLGDVLNAGATAMTVSVGITLRREGHMRACLLPVATVMVHYCVFKPNPADHPAAPDNSMSDGMFIAFENSDSTDCSCIESALDNESHVIQSTAKHRHTSHEGNEHHPIWNADQSQLHQRHGKPRSACVRRRREVPEPRLFCAC